MKEVNTHTKNLKFYHKIESSFQTGVMRNQFGTPLAKHVNSSNHQQKKAFKYVDVQIKYCILQGSSRALFKN